MTRTSPASTPPRSPPSLPNSLPMRSPRQMCRPPIAQRSRTSTRQWIPSQPVRMSSQSSLHTPFRHPRSRAGFLHFYGWMGVPIVIIFLLSALWTSMLAVIQQEPTPIANWLMETKVFDEGEFWLLPKPDDSISIAATVLLFVFALGYVSLVVLMMFPDKLMHTHKKATTATDNGSVRALGAKVRGLESIKGGVPRLGRTIPEGWTKARLVFELTSPHGIVRHYYNPMLDLPKLIFQTATLSTYLHDGFPIAIIANLHVTARERSDPHYVVCRIFYSFDLFFAVFAPLEVLVYAHYNFKFDRAAFAVRLETLPPGRLGIKSALNLLSILKWRRTIIHLVENRHACEIKRELLAHEHHKATKLRQRQRIQNVIIAATFFIAGAAIFAHSIGAVISTKHVCKQYEQCKVPSYQWNVGAGYCSCIVFVDRHPGLKTVVEWENPPDTSATLAALAHTGNLKIIQIINRKVPTLPEELRHCVDLEQLILLYTKIHAIPEWTKEFHNLEYLHIQGDLTATQLTYLPPDLFHNMPQLTFLHLGSHVKLTTIPDLSRLHNLAYLTFGMLHSVTELPSLDGLIGLHRFSIIDLIQLSMMPSVRKLTKLKAFSLLNRSPMCCNGFFPQPCNLTDFSCKDRTSEGEPLVQCSAERMPTEDYTHIKSLGVMACPVNAFDLKNNRQTLFNTDYACGGVKYKQCKLGSLAGICYPNLMQTLSCLINAGLANMRRLEIARRVGEACNPDVEAWLGCTTR